MIRENIQPKRYYHTVKFSGLSEKKENTVPYANIPRKVLYIAWKLSTYIRSDLKI